MFKEKKNHMQSPAVYYTNITNYYNPKMDLQRLKI